MYLRRNNKIRSEVSFDEPLNIDWDGNELLLSDVLGTEEDIITKDLEANVDRKLLLKALQQLNDREKQIMELRFGLQGGEEKTQKTSRICSGSPSPTYPGLKRELSKDCAKNSIKWSKKYYPPNFQFLYALEALPTFWLLDMCIFFPPKEILNSVQQLLLGGKDVARNKVEICGVDTSKLPVLKNEEMRILFREMQSGNSDAREKLVNGNLRLVLSVIQRFNNRGEFVDDLFQVGCIGLMKSIDNFDLGQNVKFSTYAVPMIIGEIRRYLRDNNPIRVSRSLRDIAYKALQVREQLMSKTSREPTAEEISRVLEVPHEEIVFALDAIQDPVSLFEPIYNDGGDPIYVMDQLSDEKTAIHTGSKKLL